MHDYLSQRLDGARDLYLLALALGERESGPPRTPFGPMIQEARIHFESVIVEARTAGLDTRDIQAMLARDNEELIDSIRPEIRERLERLLQYWPSSR
jgi:hypothetical protein